MNYVITGGSSFIGMELAKLLVSSGEHVTSVCRQTSNTTSIPKEVEIAYAEMHNIDRLSDCVSKADVFVHLAWSGLGHEGRNNKALQDDNVKCAVDALNVAAKLGCKLFVFAGSQAEYGLVTGKLTEDTPCDPQNEYGKAKLAFCTMAEKLCPQLGMKFIHLRILSIYGERDKEWTMVKSVLKKMLDNVDVELSTCTQKWNFIYIRDAVKQIYLLCKYAIECQSFNNETYLVASDDTRPLKSFIEEMYRLSGSKSKLLYGTYKPINTVKLDPDVSKTRGATNGFISDYSFDDGIALMMESKE